jgi:hypothetical protein
LCRKQEHRIADLLEHLVHLNIAILRKENRILSNQSDFTAAIATLQTKVSAIGEDVTTVRDFLQGLNPGTITQAQLDQAVADLTTASEGLGTADAAFDSMVTPPVA